MKNTSYSFYLKVYLKVLCALAVSGLGHTADSKIPEFARSNFKIGNYAVVTMPDKNIYVGKIFGLVRSSKNPDEVTHIILEHIDDSHKGKVLGPYKVEFATTLYSYVEGLSKLRSGDPVYVESRTSAASVVGVYYGSDGFSAHCLRFIGGNLDNRVGCNWTTGKIKKIKRSYEGDFPTGSYASRKTYNSDESDIFLVIGEINDDKILLKNYNDMNKYEIISPDKLIPFQTANRMPLTLPSEEAEIEAENEIKNEEGKTLNFKPVTELPKAP
ncbi:MAG: hypothetical protein R3A80_11460 [Bdellovibrionota bacterium]